MFIYRDEYYLGEESDQQGIAEVILAKHRNGPTGTIKLSWLRRYREVCRSGAAAGRTGARPSRLRPSSPSG
jgi:replicative DNA helicase